MQHNLELYYQPVLSELMRTLHFFSMLDAVYMSWPQPQILIVLVTIELSSASKRGNTAINEAPPRFGQTILRSLPNLASSHEFEATPSLFVDLPH